MVISFFSLVLFLAHFLVVYNFLFNIRHLCISTMKIISHKSARDRSLSMERKVALFYAVLVCVPKTTEQQFFSNLICSLVGHCEQLKRSRIKTEFTLSFSSVLSNFFSL